MRGLARLVYRDIDVRRPESAIAEGPVLAVANHFGGLSDGVLLIDASPRMPRVIARDLIWKVPVVGQLATAIGMIPVHRAADGAGTSNDQAFASAYEALGHGDLVLIFPEGVTQDVPYMAEVHTGAARIALGARHSGVAGIRIVPIGLHYENKAGFRSRALVNVGDPIDLDGWADTRDGDVADGADDREAVEDLTALIDTATEERRPRLPRLAYGRRAGDGRRGAAERRRSRAGRRPPVRGSRPPGGPARTACPSPSGASSSPLAPTTSRPSRARERPTGHRDDVVPRPSLLAMAGQRGCSSCCSCPTH